MAQKIKSTETGTATTETGLDNVFLPWRLLCSPNCYSTHAAPEGFSTLLRQRDVATEEQKLPQLVTAVQLLHFKQCETLKCSLQSLMQIPADKNDI